MRELRSACWWGCGTLPCRGCLAGLSLTVILWGKKVFVGNPEAFYLYGFFLALWIFRVVVAVIYPCPPESNVWMSYGQLGGSVIVMFLLLASFIRITVAMRERNKGGN